MLKILFYLNRGFLKRHFFPTAPRALKSAAKICMYKTELAFFLLLGRSGAGRGRAFRGRRDGGSRRGRGSAGPGTAAAGLRAGSAGLAARPPCARYSGMCGMLPLPGFCVLREASVHLHLSAALCLHLLSRFPAPPVPPSLLCC